MKLKNERILDLEEQVLKFLSLIICIEAFQDNCSLMGLSDYTNR